jgi:hypothetical protein
MAIIIFPPPLRMIACTASVLANPDNPPQVLRRLFLISFPLLKTDGDKNIKIMT